MFWSDNIGFSVAPKRTQQFSRDVTNVSARAKRLEKTVKNMRKKVEETVMIQDNGYNFGKGTLAHTLMSVDKNIIHAQVPEGTTAIHFMAFGSQVKTVHIPASVSSIFGGPGLSGDSTVAYSVAEDSPYFCADDGILYSKDKRMLIRYPASKPDKSFAVPDHVECISDHAFASAQYLEEVYILTTVHAIKWTPFTDCQVLRAIHVADNNLYFSSRDGVLFTSNAEKLIQYPSAKTDEEYTVPNGVEVICAEAFANNQHLRKLQFSDTVRVIGKYGCANMGNLEQVKLPDGLEAIFSMAFCCERVESKLPNLVVPSGVECIGGWAFSGIQHVEYRGVAADASWGAKSIN